LLLVDSSRGTGLCAACGRYQGWTRSTRPCVGCVHSLRALSGSKVDHNTRRGVAPPAMPRRSPQGHSSQAAAVAGHAVAETAIPGQAGHAQHDMAVGGQPGQPKARARRARVELPPVLRLRRAGGQREVLFRVLAGLTAGWRGACVLGEGGAGGAIERAERLHSPITRLAGSHSDETRNERRRAESHRSWC